MPTREQPKSASDGLAGTAGRHAASERRTGSTDFICVGDVIHLSRRHRPLAEVLDSIERKPGPESLDHCLLVRQRSIQPFHFAGDLRWIDYSVLPERQRRQAKPGSAAHIAIYDADEVFAPVKVVIAEHPAPIRCVLTYLPVYPARGTLGLIRPGQCLWLAYAVTAVLNSPCGQALYERLHWIHHGCQPSTDG